MDNYLAVIKNKVKGNKKTENLVVLIILSVILLIATNYIFNDEEVLRETVSDNIQVVNNTKNTLEENIEEILNAIENIEEAKVIISYSNTESINPVYDTRENVNSSSSGTTSTTEKNVAYEEVNGEKVAIVASRNVAKADGAVVVFNGNGDSSLDIKVKEAVSAITGIALHKIQVFQNGK